MIDPKALDAAFGQVLAKITALLGEGDVIAIDGKGQLLPNADAGPEGWASRDKFAAVL
jgi:hypothetical protein